MDIENRFQTPHSIRHFKRPVTIGTVINGDGTFKQNFKIVIMEFLQEVHCMLFLTLEDDDAGMPLPTVNSYQELSELLTNTSQSMGESTDSDSSNDSSATKKTYTGEESLLATQILLYFKYSPYLPPTIEVARR